LADWFLGDFAHRAATSLGLGSDCSITLRRLGVDRRVGSSSDLAGRCDDIENHLGEGACIHAMDVAHVVLVRDLSTEARWPAWTSAARDAGYLSAAAFPASVGTGAEIAFNIYSQRRDPWTGDVVARGGVQFIRESVAAGRPFMAELATFTPHRPAVPAPRHAQLFQDLELPMTGAFGRAIHDPPRWLGKRRALSGADLAELRERFRRRARSVQAIDEMLGMVRRTLDELGVAGNTYVVFTSDNGYHLGQYRLTHGKRTPYDADIRVPTVIAGPGLPAAVASTALASNVDFAPTFLHWAGAERRGQDGRSLDRVLRGQTPRRWRRGVLVVHHLDERPPRRTDFGARLAQDPDAQDWRMGMPGTYAAIRTRDHLYVQHRNGSRELYDLHRDPDELQNLAGSMVAGARARWALRLARLAACAGPSCRLADRFR